MNIKSIETFLRVAELGSFTRAAESMNYVQSTVTIQIQQLERELGFPLFDRMGKTIFLTAYGQEFLSYANSILQATQKAHSIGKGASEMRGILRVGTITSLFPCSLRYAVPLYKQQYPNIDLQIRLDLHYAAMSLLNENKIDMLYRSGPLDMNPNFVCHYKRKEDLVFVANCKHPLIQKNSVKLCEVFEYEFITTEPDGICNGILRELARLNNGTIRNYMTMASLSCLVLLLEQSSNVISFMPENYASYATESGMLKVINVEDMEPQNYYSQIFIHKDKWVTPYMQGMIDIICDINPERD